MKKPAASADYCTRVVTDLDELDAARWDALVAMSSGNPFVSHAFLQTLTSTGCATASRGWTPAHLTLWSPAGELVGATPRYLKDHSYGEYVFDWAWADAYSRHGIEYYPKWLCAVPFSPVPGPRLLAIDDEARAALTVALIAQAESSGLSSLHLLHVAESESKRLAAAGLLMRSSVQFHWFNAGYANFDDYLAALVQAKRKKVRAERRKVREAGVSFERKVAADITEKDWDFFYRCYANTYAAHLSTPYLTRSFFTALAQTMPRSLLLVVARRGGQPIASAFALFDHERLYGRYWGAVEQVPCLHFEASYYQMIEFAIERQLAVFEGGAQGEHKLARGFEPVTTRSAHWLAHPAFADAVERYLQREASGIEAYVDELNERSALRAQIRTAEPAA
jgi:uncharacterized protein